MPSTVMALWSDGPAPPRRLSAPTLGSTSRTPKDCSSFINFSAGIRSSAGKTVRTIGFIGLVPGFEWHEGRSTLRGYSAHGGGLSVVEVEAEEFRPGIMSHRVHHSLTLDDQTHVQVGD